MKLLLSILLITISVKVFAQEEMPAADTIKLRKVMLIPYDPRYYLSDADRDIMEQSKMEPDKFRSGFRQNIDRHVQRYIGRSYECISLLNDTADHLEQTMYKIMGRTGYRYEKAIPITPKPQDDDQVIIKAKSSSTKEHEDSNTASQYIPVKNDAMYMHAVVTKPDEIFAELYEEYQADFFVFLTQFDIKTNYNSCLDIANKIYRREVMVHFSIYNKEGDLLAGSYATSYFPSDTNHPNTIMGDCFPDIAKYIAGCLP